MGVSYSYQLADRMLNSTQSIMCAVHVSGSWMLFIPDRDIISKWHMGNRLRKLYEPFEFIGSTHPWHASDYHTVRQGTHATFEVTILDI